MASCHFTHISTMVESSSCGPASRQGDCTSGLSGSLLRVLPHCLEYSLHAGQSAKLARVTQEEERRTRRRRRKRRTRKRRKRRRKKKRCRKKGEISLFLGLITTERRRQITLKYKVHLDQKKKMKEKKMTHSSFFIC